MTSVWYKRRMARPLVLSSLLLLSACGGGLDRAAFVVDQPAYPQGGRVSLRLTNTSGLTLGINLCLAQLVADPSLGPGPSDGSTCALESTDLPDGEATEWVKHLPEGLPAGRWRYETTLKVRGGAGEKAYTQPFTVGP